MESNNADELILSTDYAEEGRFSADVIFRENWRLVDSLVLEHFRMLQQ